MWNQCGILGHATKALAGFGLFATAQVPDKPALALSIMSQYFVQI